MAPRFLLLAAMPQEREPFLGAAGLQRPGPSPHSTVTDVEVEGVPGQILLTGIGPVAAAAALSAWLATHPAPAHIISVGSAGGLHPSIDVGEVVVGCTYRYADVDARQFGYEFGQVPGMPAAYPGPAPHAETLARSHGYVHAGLVVTASSFISAELAGPIREQFPGALAVDMESAALAQTCHLHGAPAFTSIRGISDLCTPRAGADFHDGLGLAAQRSFEITRTLIAALAPGSDVLA